MVLIRLWAAAAAAADAGRSSKLWLQPRLSIRSVPASIPCSCNKISGWSAGRQHRYTRILPICRYRDRRQINLIWETGGLQMLLLLLLRLWTLNCTCVDANARLETRAWVCWVVRILPATEIHSHGAGPREGAGMHPFPQSGLISGAITSRCEMTRGSFVPEVRTTQDQGAERPWQPCLGGGLG